MADQNLSYNRASGETGMSGQADVVTVAECDAASSQKVTFIPPTGEDRNVVVIALVVIAALVIISAGVLIVKNTKK